VEGVRACATGGWPASAFETVWVMRIEMNTTPSSCPPSLSAIRNSTFAQRFPPKSQKKDAKRTQEPVLALSKTLIHA